MTLVKFKNQNGTQLNNQVPFNSFFNDLLEGDFFGGQSFSRVPDVNILEENENYIIEVALPGFTKDQVNVKIEDDVLTISSAKEGEKEHGRYLKREFNSQAFRRSFNISETMDTDSIKAEMKNGILFLHIPKKEEAKPQIKEIKIS